MNKYLKCLWLVPVIANLAGKWFGVSWLAACSKPLLMPLIALSVFLLLKEHDVRGRRVSLIILALVAGTVGDVLLMFRGTGPFIAGIIAFFIGHILYFSVLPAPWKVKGVFGKILTFLLFACLAVVVLTVLGRFDLEGALGVAVRVYAFAFVCLITAAIAAGIDRRRPLYFIAAIGFLLFAISDTFIAIGDFTATKVPRGGFIVMSTYIAAQAIVAFSLAWQEIRDLEKTEYGVRVRRLYALWDALKARENAFIEAFDKDFGKGSFETYTTEIGFLYNDIRHTLSHFRDWIEPGAPATPMVLWPGKSRVISEPYGKVLVIGPFNYPLHLVVAPLAAALAAGNTAVVKTSRQTPNVSRLVSEMLTEAFDPEVVEVLGNDVSNEEMLSRRYDYIFFTGSPRVGKIVMEAASKHLTPVTLELGGKSPAIICESAPVRLACERIAKGKFINGGQTCVAPDYVLVHESVHDEFISTMRSVIHDFFGDIQTRPAEMTLIATKRHYDRIVALFGPSETGSDSPDSSLRSAPPISRRDCEDKSSHSLHRSGPLPLTSLGWLRSGLARPVSDGEVVIGGYTDAEINYISPTVIDRCGWDHPAMGEEIFGPVLPVITFKDLQTEVIDKVKEGEKPLSLYIFSKNRKEIRTVLQQVSFGGGCVNETIMHIGNENMPFGGVGESGIGSYHGRDGFDTFSHKKSMLIKSSWFNIDLLKPPYGKKLKLIRKVYK